MKSLCSFCASGGLCSARSLSLSRASYLSLRQTLFVNTQSRHPEWRIYLPFFSSKPVRGACTVIGVLIVKPAPPSSSVHSPRPANGAAANQITRSIAWCPTAPSRSAWTPCTSRSSAAPSVKTVNTHRLQKHTHPSQSLSFHQNKDGRLICGIAVWWPHLWTIRT